MRTEDTINHFTSSLVSVAGIFAHLEDDFFVKKLRAKMEIFTAGYIKLSREEGTNVAQYYLIEKSISDTDDILELFELIIHLGKSKKTTPLLLAGRNLMAMKLELLKVKNSLAISLKKKEDSIKNEVSKSNNPDPVAAKNIAIPQKSVRQVPWPGRQELNPNKEKILNFIKKSPNTRTKDIIHEFNALSDRTVKRNLGELLKVGLINRKIENKAVYYSAEN